MARRVSRQEARTGPDDGCHVALGKKPIRQGRPGAPGERSFYVAIVTILRSKSKLEHFMIVLHMKCMQLGRFRMGLARTYP